ncbi:AAA-associated domain-containing protein [Cyanobium sp. Morenito 9A2]|uniref:AAA-associated domain-containing protein n=1 Tax=Cyanobium sp. Morenito 9A2 TaxID=2823718 RepID=UPI0020CE4185|nr:AAA-associated domain-containing protein [Cyanobium sp. Morenito 9A2]MCP9848539.1 AAA-associated domain-containing protein [Cyanobium sp. Morenito 9A2]
MHHPQPRLDGRPGLQLPGGFVDAAGKRPGTAIAGPAPSFADGAGDLVALVPETGAISLAGQAEELVLELDDLPPMIDAGELLALMDADGARLQLTVAGRQLLKHVPLVRQLQAALEASPRGEVEGGTVLEQLSEQFTGQEAEAVFDTVISWTRSCGLFRYNREQDRFRLAASEARSA